jgi:hypothetical protein
VTTPSSIPATGGRAVTTDYPALLAEWLRRIRVNVSSHNAAERRFAWLDNVMGAISLGSIVLLGTVASGEIVAAAWKPWLIAVTAIGALTSAFQTQLRLGPTAMAHQAAARQYSALRRAVEEAQRLSPDQLVDRVDAVRQQWDFVASSAPNVPTKLRDRAKSRKGVQ